MEYRVRDGVVQALDRISLAFDEGSFVCIVGPSGCGKTTLLQILAGFVTATSGRAWLDKRPITGPGPERGVVFQQPALFPWMTVFRNAEFGPMVRGVDASHRRATVERYLRLVGLWEFRRRFPYQLSGGMQQRLAIVRALVNDPRMLLMDEPFGALDALTREKMQEQLHEVWQRTRMTVVFVTHSVEEAVYLGTHVVVMSARPGRVLEQLEVPFSRQADGSDIRSIKASPAFVGTREHVLGLIWSTAG
jgi:ABC-type taurine transport system ATPase subunit